MKGKTLVALIVILAVAVVLVLILKDKGSAPTEVVLQGYVDSVGRRGYQQIINVYADGKSYPGIYFYVGSENQPVNFNDSNQMALVIDGDKLISEPAVFDQLITIIGTKTEGKICYIGEKTLEPSKEIEICHQMSVVKIGEISDQNNVVLFVSEVD